MSDRILRAKAANDEIRAFAAITTNLVNDAHEAHNTSRVVTAGLGRLLTAASMMGVMLKGDDELVTIQIKSIGPMKGLTVTGKPNGDVKGFPLVNDVQIPPRADGHLDVGGALGEGYLSVSKDMGLENPYSGMVKLTTGEIGDDLANYFVSSEQIPTGVGLGVLVDKDDSVAVAGGFIVQLMPFASDETLDKLEANLSKITSVTDILKENHNPYDLLNAALDGFDIQVTDEVPTNFVCNCTRERVSQVIAGLGKKEIEKIIEEDTGAELKCQFCNKAYRFTTDQLKDILAFAKK